MEECMSCVFAICYFTSLIKSRYNQTGPFVPAVTVGGAQNILGACCAPTVNKWKVLFSTVMSCRLDDIIHHLYGFQRSCAVQAIYMLWETVCETQVPQSYWVSSIIYWESEASQDKTSGACLSHHNDKRKMQEIKIQATILQLLLHYYAFILSLSHPLTYYCSLWPRRLSPFLAYSLSSALPNQSPPLNLITM